MSIGASNSKVCKLLRLILTVLLVLFMICSKGAHRDRALETGVSPEHGVLHALKLCHPLSLGFCIWESAMRDKTRLLHCPLRRLVIKVAVAQGGGLRLAAGYWVHEIRDLVLGDEADRIDQAQDARFFKHADRV